VIIFPVPFHFQPEKTNRHISWALKKLTIQACRNNVGQQSLSENRGRWKIGHDDRVPAYFEHLRGSNKKVANYAARQFADLPVKENSSCYSGMLESGDKFSDL